MDKHAPEKLDSFFHKEKYQKKNNKTIGQIDKLKKYTNAGNKSNDKLTISDKQISREQRYIKNLDIDNLVARLTEQGLLMEQYQDWYFKVCHTLGTGFVAAQAEIAIMKGNNPQALFHFLINKAMNKSIDAYLPRFNNKTKN